MMRRVLETAVILLGTLSWWGFVYPELCLLETTNTETCGEGYVCEATSDEAQEESRQKSSGLDYKEEKSRENLKPSGAEAVIQVPMTTCNSCEGKKEIRIKSKLVEYVYQIRNQETEKEIRNGK